jgi:shikimate dehydrogenase
VISVLCLVPERPEWIRVYDVDRDKAGELLADCGMRFDISPVEVVGDIDGLALETADLLINATPVGMKPSDPCLVKAEQLHPGMLVYDLIYNPRETPLLRTALARGARVSNGLGMLFYQGVLAFQHWAEIELDQSIKEGMREALTAALKGTKERP